MKMREILFRGQMRKKGEKFTIGGYPLDSIWIYGGIFAASMKSDRCIITSYDDCKKYPVHADTVGQYTGLTDKNGTKIFEGDILKSDDGNIGIIRWYDEEAAFLIWCTNKRRLYYLGDNNFSRIEVIDNIYDNPELLKRGYKT